MEVKPAEFARMAGVTRQSVYSKIKNGTLVVNSAGFLDTDNPLNTRYLSDQRLKKNRFAPAQLPGPAGSAQAVETPGNPPYPGPPPPLLITDANIAAEAGVPQELLDLPLRELIIRFGGLYGLERQAKILQQITTANEKYQRTQERAGKTISKDFVQGTAIQFLKTLSRQIMEYPDAAANDLMAKFQAHGADAKPDVIQALRNGLGRIIAGSKEELIRELTTLKGKPSAGEIDLQAGEEPEND